MKFLCIATLAAFLLLTQFIPSSRAKEQGKALEQFILYPIGHVAKGNGQTMIVLDKAYQPGLMGLEEFSHIYVLFWFDRNDTPQKRSILQVHPKGNKNNPLTGVFATRAPVRPNLIGTTLCNIVSVRNNIIHIDNIDALPNTPVLDIKPYIPSIDSTKVTISDWLKVQDK